MAPFDLQKYLHKANGDRTITPYKKGQKIYSQGDACDAVYYILEGQVKLTVRSEQGKEAVVAIQGDGDFFGENCLTGAPKRLESVSAHVEGEILRLPGATIRSLLD